MDGNIAVRTMYICFCKLFSMFIEIVCAHSFELHFVISKPRVQTHVLDAFCNIYDDFSFNAQRAFVMSMFSWCLDATVCTPSSSSMFDCVALNVSAIFVCRIFKGVQCIYDSIWCVHFSLLSICNGTYINVRHKRKLKSYN